MQHRLVSHTWRLIAIMSLLITAPLVMAAKAPTPPAHHVAQPHATTDEWPTFMHDTRRTGASSDTSISTANAASLTKLWSFHTGGGLAAQPTVTGGVVYVGSWDGYMYALNAATGAQIWRTFLGQTVAPLCQPATIGITSAAAVQNGIVYVGGGDTYWYALDAATGAVLWKVFTGDNSPTGGYYNWASPLLYNGYAYIGIASNCDDPLVPGALMQVDLTSHGIVKSVPLVPTGQVGGGIWTSPSVDPATNTVYVTTGTKNQPAQTLPQSMLAFDAGTMALKGQWHIPEADAVVDSDWGATPTLYDDAQGRHWAVASNKDGYLYAFDRTNVNGGPVWRHAISIGGACPTCGDGSIASTAFANNTVFVAGGNATLANGKGYPGDVRALDPATGNVLWERGDQGPIVPAVTWVNNLLIAEPGNTVEVLDATTGARLWSYATGAPLYAAASIAEGTIFTGSVDGNVYAFAPSAPGTPPADGACPATWACQDVGAPSPAGNESVAGGTWTVSAGGVGLAANGSDQIRLMTQPANGDTQVTTQITSVSAGTAGVMLRQSNLPGAPFYAVSASGGGNVAVQYRTTFGGAITTVNRAGTLALPFTVRALRVGDTFAAATSPDGTTFTLVPGGTASLMLPTTTLAGIWSASGTTGVAATSVLANPTVAAAGALPPAQASPSACPATWACGDIGNPLIVGDQSLAGGAWTVKGAGNDINSYADQFHYVWQTIAADATLSAHITAQTNTNGSAKAGIMLRGSADAGAPFYGLFATPGSGLQVVYRTAAGLRTGQIPVGGAVPAYLQVQRSGNTFTAWTSTNGTAWTYVPGTNITLSTNGALLAGLAVTARNGGTLSVVNLDGVTLTQSAPPAPVACPTAWTCADIGFPLPAGSQSANATLSSWSVIAGGSDIYGTTDQFRLVAENLPGDGTFSARVLTQTYTNDWAKAGVMIRQSTDPGSPDYGMFISPGHGVVVQWRSVQGGGAAQMSVTTTTTYPTYMKVGRVGNTFTAYTSPDGGTWTAVPGSTTTIAMSGVVLAGMAATSHNNGNQGVITYDKVVLVATCLTGWSCTDIGDTIAIPGGNAFVNNIWSVYGGGTDIWATSDQFHYLWQVQAGDGSISADVTAQANTDPNAKSGLMFRQSVDPASPYYAAYLTPGNGVVVQYRTASGQFAGQAATVAGTAPVYLKLTRSGTNYTAYTSPNGTAWTLIPGSSVNLTVGGPFLAGLAVTGHNPALLGSATFAAVSLNAPAPPTCPVGWTCGDIGNPPLAGGQSLTNGTWVVQGNGADIWATSDQFHYVWQSVAADATVTARITAQANTDPNAKAGLMFRQTNDPASPFYDLVLTPGGLSVQYRVTQGAYTGNQATIAGAVPAWLRVVRQGNVFTAYSSADGVTWTLIPNSTKTIGVAGAFLAGMAVTSHQVTIMGSATFTNVAVTAPTVSTCPNGWACSDIGPVTTAGNQSLNGNVWTISGSGTDIYGTADQFHFVYQTTAGNNALAAHITAQGNTSGYAKAGIMFRLSTDPGSPYYAVFVTPSNGVLVQYRAAQGNSAGNAGTAIAGATVPQYLRVLRAGTTFTAYTSPDGLNWTLIPGSSKTLPNLTGSLLLGLAITAHNGAKVSTATLDGVTFATANAITPKRDPHGRG